MNDSLQRKAQSAKLKRWVAPIIGGLALSFALCALRFAPPLWAADAKTDSADQTDNNYYWQGTQLYNLGRLGEAFESFEKAIQRKQNSKEAEAYLLQIRQEIVNSAKKRSDEKNSLNYGGNTPDTALNVSYVQKGFIRVMVQSKYLFDENAASLKPGAMDVISRLAEVLQAKEGQRVEVDAREAAARG